MSLANSVYLEVLLWLQLKVPYCASWLLGVVAKQITSETTRALLQDRRRTKAYYAALARALRRVQKNHPHLSPFFLHEDTIRALDNELRRFLTRVETPTPEGILAAYSTHIGRTPHPNLVPVALELLTFAQEEFKKESALQSLITDRQMESTSQGVRELKSGLLPKESLPTFPNDEDLSRLADFATGLLEAGKRSWNMPRFVASLTLEARLQTESDRTATTSVDEIARCVEAGEHTIVFGSGGIGKTTFLLDLCAVCLHAKHRIPLFVDAAVWARTNLGLYDYLSKTPAAQQNKITNGELASLADRGRLVIVLNGWNEIPGSMEILTHDNLIKTAALTTALNFVISSRTQHDIPNLHSAALHIEVRGLTWLGQLSIIRQELDQTRAAHLIDFLARDTRLRHAARSPLILRGLLTQAYADKAIGQSVYELLGATVEDFEREIQHRAILSAAPIEGHQRIYLEEVALVLTEQSSTTCTRNDALRAINSAAQWLKSEQRIHEPGAFGAILEDLASHHLLHLDNDTVRFAHQRFQEFFAASRILRETATLAEQSALLLQVMILPSWTQALRLAVEYLNGMNNSRHTKNDLIKKASTVDLGLACFLAGLANFDASHDAQLHSLLVTQIQLLSNSSSHHIKHLATVYKKLSRFTEFADELWRLLEGSNQQTRLLTYQLGGEPISLAQLGLNWETQFTAWPVKLKEEFIAELGDSQDSYDFLTRLALNEQDHAVRVAAISALFWSFPASEVAMNAWIAAPFNVKTNRSIINYIKGAIQDGYASEAVHHHLQALAQMDIPDDLRVTLAMDIPPNQMDERSIEAIFNCLRDEECNWGQTDIVHIAAALSSKRMLELAQAICFDKRHSPDWAMEFLKNRSPLARSITFKRLLDQLVDMDENRLDPALGALANAAQVNTCVVTYLDIAARGRDLSDIEIKHKRLLEQLLANVSGADLVEAVMTLAVQSDYPRSSILIDLLASRLDARRMSTRTASDWQPDVDQVRRLVAGFADKTEDVGNGFREDAIRKALSYLAAHTNENEFDSLVIDTCRAHLDAWNRYDTMVSSGSFKPGPRLMNPQGHRLIQTLGIRGFPILHQLMTLLNHPHAMKLIPEGINLMMTRLWLEGKDSRTGQSESTKIVDGVKQRELNRVLAHPDPAWQKVSDEVAILIGTQLENVVAAELEKKRIENDKWNYRQAEHMIGRLASVVSVVPSKHVVAPAYAALKSGIMSVYTTVNTLGNLLRQGVRIEQPDIIAAIEFKYDQMENESWLDQGTQHAMAQLSQIIACTIKPSTLSKPLSHYIEQWCRYSYPSTVVRELEATRSPESWPATMEFAQHIESSPSAEARHGLAAAIVSCLGKVNVDEFISLIRTGQFLRWTENEWSLDGLAQKIALVITEYHAVDTFVAACRATASPLADVLAIDVMSWIDKESNIGLSILLDSIDSGRAFKSQRLARKLYEQFEDRIPLSSSMTEISERENGTLRFHLYERAKGSGPIALACRNYLAVLEIRRLERGRPDTELRHPHWDGSAWTDVFKLLA